jgi:hypothetical protein
MRLRRSNHSSYRVYVQDRGPIYLVSNEPTTLIVFLAPTDVTHVGSSSCVSGVRLLQ